MARGEVRVDAKALQWLLKSLVAQARRQKDPLPDQDEDMHFALKEATRGGGEGENELTVPQIKRLLSGVPSMPDAPVATTISQILFYLVQRFREPLELGETIEDAVQAISEKTRNTGGSIEPISPVNIGKLFDGSTASPHTRTLERLAEVFRPAWPQLRASWLEARSFASFRRAAGLPEEEGADADRGHSSPSLIRTYHAQEDALRAHICGVFICYRYAFQSDYLPGEVSREVLHVWEENDVLLWSMSFDRFKETGTAPCFRGQVLPMGGTLFLVGSHETAIRNGGVEVPTVERGRSLLLYEDPRRKSVRDVKFGLMTSTMSAHPNLPCAGCVVLVRAAGYDNADRHAIEQLVKSATSIQRLEAIVFEDFKTKAADDPFWVAAFLDNRVAGSVSSRSSKNSPFQDTIDRKLTAWQRPRGSRDQTLKIDIQRFYDFMPAIVERVKSNPDNATYFKQSPR